MTSDHVDNRKLYEVVHQTAVLDPSEIEHLKTCEECLEMIRVLIRHNLSKGAKP